MDNKKKYVKPVAETVDFEAGDIITYSTHGTAPDDWNETPGAEDWGGGNQYEEKHIIGLFARGFNLIQLFKFLKTIYSKQNGRRYRCS